MLRIWILILTASIVFGDALDSLHIVDKKEWGGAAIADSMDTTPYRQTIRYITVHHGGVFFDPATDPVEYLKHLQKFSTKDKGWMDIPYHYLIDPQGMIYAARPPEFAGDTNTEYDPHGHVLICVIGNYEVQKVNRQQLTAMIDLILALMQKYTIPRERVATHRDYSKMTVCPGKNLYRYFQEGWVRSMLKSRKKYLKSGY